MQQVRCRNGALMIAVIRIVCVIIGITVFVAQQAGAVTLPDTIVQSHFGAAAISGVKEHARALGSHWARLPTNITEDNWDTPNTYFDAEMQDYQDSAVAALGILSPRKNSTWLTPAQFANAVTKYVERYDGDGISDMGGLKYPITSWELFNEYGSTNPEYTGLSTESFVLMMQAAVAAMKAACPTCTLVYNPFSKAAADSLVAGLGADSINVISFHTYSPLDQALHPSDSFYSVNFPAFLASVNLTGKPVWATEYAFYDHLGANPPNTMAASQEANARWLIQTTIWGMATGKFSRIFYAEITAPQDSTANLQFMALIDSAGVKRKNYYAFAKMSELIDWYDTVATLSLDTNVYGYKFTRGDSRIYVVWSKEATGTHSNVNVTGFSGSSATRIVAVPDASGNFETSIVTVTGGAVTMDIPETPAYIIDGEASLDTSGPNAWYVNDTSTTGDSFTTAVGSDANSGLSAALPKRTLAAVDHLLTAGDTVYVDSGFYYEAETIVVSVNNVLIQGVDSSGTTIRFDSNTAQACRTLQVRNATGCTIRDLGVTNAYFGISLSNGDQGVVTRVKTLSNGYGIHLLNADTNSISSSFSATNSNGIYAVTSGGNTFSAIVTSSNVGSGIRLDTCSGNTVQGCTSTNDFEEAYIIRTGGNNTLTGNYATGSAYAFGVENSSNNIVIDNKAVSNGDGIWLDTSTGNLIRGNLCLSSTRSGITLRGPSNDNTVTQNQLTMNGWWQINIVGLADADTFTANNMIVSAGNPDSGVFAGTPNALSFARNWWGSSDSTILRADIAGIGKDSIIFEPYKLAAVDTSVNADTVAPSMPTGLATDSPYAKIRITWTPPATNENGQGGDTAIARYKVYRARSQDTTNWLLMGDTTASAFLDSNVAADTFYYYRVTAVDNASPVSNESYYSAIVAGRTYRAAGDFSGDSAVTSADVALILPRVNRSAYFDPIYDIGRGGPDGLINFEDLFALGNRFGQ